VIGAWWLLGAAHAGETVLLARGAGWRYLDDGIDPGADWTAVDFDDTAWDQGPAPLGYGIFGVATTVDFGPDPLRRYPTTWFRTTFQVTDPSAFEAISVHLRRDDGAAVYVNGVEVLRNNLAVGATSGSYATSGVYGVDQDAFYPGVVPAGVLVPGTNTVAVELHNQSGSSPDLVMDLGLSGWDGPTAVTRGPWLQQTGPDGALVRWNTDGPGPAQLWWGSTPGDLPHTVVDPTIAFAHEVRITGVPAGSDVVYAVGHPTAGVLAGDDRDHVLHTAPAPGAREPFRVWVLGDSGTASADAERVRDAWRGLHPDPLDTQVWLMLGDNAYGSGRDSEYQTAVFDFYPEWLRQVSLWATLGNHDGYSAFSDTQTGPYFDVFSFPTAGEVGGVASGTEAYWSFDYANVHFVDLDSYHSDRAASAPMATWLRADLAASTADWNVVFFHHPPYTKGSHDSDREPDLVEIREVLVPILEEYGVDLVLSGHSHSYERSWLLDGHYGLSDTFGDEHVVQTVSGDPSVDGPYTKWQVGSSPRAGVVYAVAGSSGQRSGGPLDHPAMLVGLDELGSMSLEFDGLTLRAAFVDDSGATRDAFEIHKGVTTLTELGGATVGATGEALSFHVAATDPRGRAVTDFSWAWGDGTPAGTGDAPTHAWTTEGAFDVVVTATDADGATATGTWRVDIDDGVPVIERADWSGVSLEGEVLTFTALGSDPGGDPLTYTWTIEGEEVPGSTVTHAFRQDGSYVARLSVADDAGREVTAEVPVTVANAAPFVASFNVTDAREGATASLFAFPADPGADLVEVAWSLPGATATGPFVSHVFPDDGDVAVTLVLEDEDGAVTVDERVVTVENVAPTVTARRGRGGAEGDPLRLTAATTDPGASDVVTVSWAFGDGATATGHEVVHVFPDEGPWTVTATADDGDGGTATTRLRVALDGAPPAIERLRVPDDAVEGQDALLAVVASDPGAADLLTVTWDLGDGTTAAGARATARWPDDGVYEGSVEVVDDEGLGTSAPFVVSVANARPVFRSTPPTRIAPGAALVHALSVDDVDPVTLTLLEAPPGAALDGERLRWTAPTEAGVTHPFRIRADDGDGGVTELGFAVRVAADPERPAARFERSEGVGGGCATTRGPALGGPLALAALALRRRRREPLREPPTSPHPARGASSRGAP
jgi:hypothetical protein